MPDQFLGVEHEVEGAAPSSYRNTPLTAAGWVFHQDGSLRNNGAEFVFNGGVPGGTALQRLTAFEEEYTRRRWTSSFRTSTHVHIGFTNEGGYADGIPADNMLRAQSFLKAYYVLEPAFFAFAGEDRQNSGYCEPFDRSVSDFLKIVSAKDVQSMHRAVENSSRYYGCNPKSLSKHGTIEFRHMPLTPSVTRLSAWINLILRLKKWVYTQEETSEFASVISAAGYEGFVVPILEAQPELVAALPVAEFKRRLSVLTASETAQGESQTYPRDEYLHHMSQSDIVKAFRAKIEASTPKRKSRARKVEEAETAPRQAVTSPIRIPAYRNETEVRAVRDALCQVLGISPPMGGGATSTTRVLAERVQAAGYDANAIIVSAMQGTVPQVSPTGRISGWGSFDVPRTDQNAGQQAVEAQFQSLVAARASEASAAIWELPPAPLEVEAGVTETPPPAEPPANYYDEEEI
jgi:hypothetical protein